MITEMQFATYTFIFVVISALVLHAHRLPPKPDPWEDDLSPEDVEDCDQALCTKCLAPVESPFQHYCPKCGQPTGELTGYIPFVNIPFECGIYETQWKKLTSAQSSIVSRAIAVVFLGAYAPLMLGVGLPVLLVRKLLGAHQKSAE